MKMKQFLLTMETDLKTYHLAGDRKKESLHSIYTSESQINIILTVAKETKTFLQH